MRLPQLQSAELKDALSKVVFTPKVSAPGVEEGEVASNALSGEAGTGVGHTGAPLSADRAVEDDELANVFDQTDITYTADCVLESRGEYSLRNVCGGTVGAGAYILKDSRYMLSRTSMPNKGIPRSQ